MEATTPFDLNQAIQRWRENLGQSPAFRSENLFELESHLRDSIATLQRQGLSDEEALLVTMKRLGRSATLEAEFAKQNTRSIWLDRALWIIIGAQLWGFVAQSTVLLDLLLNFCLPPFNRWLATYGFGHIRESLAVQVCYVVGFPLVLFLTAKATIAFHRWSQRRGWQPFSSILSKPRAVAGLFAVLYLAPTLFTYGMGMLASRLNWSGSLGSRGLSTTTVYLVLVLHAVAFTALVLVIARKRQRLSRA
jgi:hypothetical protein